MNTQRLFRVLLLASLVASVVAVTYHLTASGRVSEDWKTLLLWDGDGGLVNRLPDEIPPTWDARILLFFWVLVFGGFAVLTLVSQIGMMLFWRFSRSSFLVCTFFWIVLSPFLGLTVRLPVEETLYYLATLCDGAALAMAYFSPLSERFRRVRAP